jgi:D-lactate dehydrogenase
MAQLVTAVLWKASLEGKIPVVCDVSSCTNTFLHLAPALSPEWKARYEKLKFVDMVELLHDRVLPLLPEVEKRESLMMHPVCSLHKMGSTEKLLAIGRHFAHSVEQPLEGGCCGMAGDRGFFFPELGAAAASASCTSVLGEGKIFSCTATCEMALRENLKRETGSVLGLIEEAFKN